MNLNEDLYRYQQVRENYGSKIIRAHYSNQGKVEGPKSTGISPQKERTDSPFSERPDHEQNTRSDSTDKFQIRILSQLFITATLKKSDDREEIRKKTTF